MVMIIANNNEQNKELELKRFNEMLHGKTSGIEITSAKTYSLQNVVLVPAKTVLILEVH